MRSPLMWLAAAGLLIAAPSAVYAQAGYPPGPPPPAQYDTPDEAPPPYAQQQYNGNAGQQQYNGVRVYQGTVNYIGFGKLVLITNRGPMIVSLASSSISQNGVALAPQGLQLGEVVTVATRHHHHRGAGSSADNPQYDPGYAPNYGQQPSYYEPPPPGPSYPNAPIQPGADGDPGNQPNY